VAAAQALRGNAAERAAAAAFVAAQAQAQAAAGARYLDINVDAFSADVEERCAAMRWMAETAQASAPPALSIDSSHPAVLEAGLAVCDRARGAPLLNSASLERLDAIALAARHNAAVVASAAGAHAIPHAAAERLENLARLTALLAEAGIAGGRLFFDPLVLPVGVEPEQAGVTLAVIRELRRQHGAAVHIAGGFSNVSFGMPRRQLLNAVFTRLALEAGADAGIVDPLVAGPARLAALDANAEPFRRAAAVLRGDDPYGGDYLQAAREGRLG
jgi:5-methyltetrahydrofolate--homocysteine methyltransferase